MAMDQSEKIGLFSVGINSSLVLIKVILAYLSGSVALVADAIHSLSDVISSATVLAGIKISKRKSTRFPYGLYKVENLVCLLSSLFIFFAGYEIVQTVLFKEESLKPEFLPAFFTLYKISCVSTHASILKSTLISIIYTD